MIGSWSFNKKCIITFSLLFILFSACKKDRLKGDKEVLVGTWRWAYTVRDNNPGTNSVSHYIDTITPITEGDNYKIEFCKNGKIYFFKNNAEVSNHRIVFNSWDLDLGLGKNFTIKLDNNTQNRLRGSLYQEDFFGEKDTLVTWSSFPFVERDENCNPAYFDCSKTNVFVKE